MSAALRRRAPSCHGFANSSERGLSPSHGAPVVGPPGRRYDHDPEKAKVTNGSKPQRSRARSKSDRSARGNQQPTGELDHSGSVCARCGVGRKRSENGVGTSAAEAAKAVKVSAETLYGPSRQECAPRTGTEFFAKKATRWKLDGPNGGKHGFRGRSATQPILLTKSRRCGPVD